MFVCARDIVARTPDFDVLAQNMTLRPWQWEMLHAFDDRTSLGAIARRIGVDLGSITESLSALEQHGLVKIRTVTRDEYRRVFEMIATSTSAPDVLDEDEDVVRPVAVRAVPLEGLPQAKPVPPTGEPLSVRLEALRAKAEQAQAQRPPAADAAPFPAHAAPITTDEPAPTDLEEAEIASHSAAVEAAQAPPEPIPDTTVFKSKLADLKARLDESLGQPSSAATPGVTASPTPSSDASATIPPPRGAFADLSESLAADVRTEDTLAGVDDNAPLAVPIPTAMDSAPAVAPAPTSPSSSYVSSNGSANGTAQQGPIEFSLSGEPAPKRTRSADAIEFSLGNTPSSPPSASTSTSTASSESDPPKPPPLKY